jgi:hypothetical protein
VAGSSTAGSRLPIVRARVIGNRRTKWLTAKRTFFLCFREAGGISGTLTRRAAASIGVVAGVSSGVRGRLKFSFFSTTWL